MPEMLHLRPRFGDRRRLAGTCAAALLLWIGAALPAAAENPAKRQVYAHTFKHQQADEALALVRPLLTAGGTVEVQPGDNTLVIRETPEVVDRIARLLAAFDFPPEELRYEIQIIRAGPKNYAISPVRPGVTADAKLSDERVAQLRRLLRFDDYRVLAEAEVTTTQGEDVRYALGETYRVSFRSGPVLAGRRVKLEGFRIVKQAQQVSDKGRRLEPRELFHATLNLWIDRPPFNLVLDHDESRQEALMVTISCRREDGAAGATGRAVGTVPTNPATEGEPKRRSTAGAPAKRPAGGGR